ncbi:hypothetical protein [Saccharopolyspora griseoalba]|uniref:Peptidase M41 domain-containing protein n=1 Tax=Saccharopolyspora griseoalba TaxID=1431848 RepID=A0ABW2LRQ2_9PSEU
MDRGSSVSWSQVLCSSCQDEIRTRGWRPRHHDLLRGKIAEIRCPRCRASLQQLKDHHTSVRVLPWRWSTDPERAEITRQHEAAHTVIGERLGLVLDEVRVEAAQPVDLSGHSLECSGAIDWQLHPGDEVNEAALAAMLFAGPAMATEHLRTHGRDTPEALLDVAYSGAADLASLSTTLGRQAPDTVYDQGQADANRLITTYRDEIHAVAGALAHAGRLKRPEVLAAMKQASR